MTDEKFKEIESLREQIKLLEMLMESDTMEIKCSLYIDYSKIGLAPLGHGLETESIYTTKEERDAIKDIFKPKLERLRGEYEKY